MARKKQADMPPVCETLSAACASVLKMTVGQLDVFEPRTVAERLALDYAHRAGRGDDKAFNLLTATADTVAVDDLYEDELSKALREWSEEVLADYRQKHAETV